MATYILSGSRTAQGSFLGALSQVSAPKLGAVAISGAMKKANLSMDKIEELYMGTVIQAGVGQAPARQAAIFAGLAESTPSTTVNKVCGSGLKAVLLGSQAIQCGDANLVVAGGMENMSLAPHLLPNSRNGFKFGETVMRDSMQWDGLWDVYSNRAMGNCAEECATKFNISRADQDAYAIESFKRAQHAQKEGFFKNEISAVMLPSKSGEVAFTEDEGPSKANFEKIPSLKPAFEKTGTITAANASTLNDGAAALVLGGEQYKSQAKYKIVSYASHAQNPTWFTTAPITAIQKSLDKAKLKLSDIDLFEVNEAFALVSLATMKELKIDHQKMNIFGGAVALGHPIGASGARILVTLMNAMDIKKAKYGCAAICIGGGEALSVIIERC
ncbi:MAG: thiolase family protein [Bacteriovoracaceae bacterium]